MSGKLPSKIISSVFGEKVYRVYSTDNDFDVELTKDELNDIGRIYKEYLRKKKLEKLKK